jgi:hypothetical protein
MNIEEMQKSLFGLSKKEVENYILNLKNEYEAKIEKLEIENQKLAESLNKYISIEKEIEDRKDAITEVLLRSEEQARQNVEESKLKAIQEREKVIKALDEEREKIIDLKKELIGIKTNATEILENAISEIKKIN